MPPAKARALQGETDHLQPRDRQNTHSIPNTKSKRVAGPGGTTASSSKTANGANTTGSVSTGQQENAEGDASQATSWSNEDLAVLHAYRHAYRLNHPSAFQSPMSNAIFSYPGIGKYSPTMARSKERRKTTKEQLALAVRKHFNSMAVNETDVVTEFLYKTKNHDKVFRARNTPGVPTKQK